jgi:hypothetical protein
MFFLATLLLPATLSSPVSAVSENQPGCGPIRPEYLIRPGHGVGRLNLLMSREEVERILQAPFHSVTVKPYGDSTGQPNPGRVSVLYVSEGGKQFLGLAYENGKLEHIEFTSPRFQTADCRSTANPIRKSEWVEMPERNHNSGLVTVEFDQLSLPWSEKPLTYAHVSVGLPPPGPPQIIREVIDDFPSITSAPSLHWQSARQLSEGDRVFWLVPLETTVNWGRIHPEPMVSETLRYELFDETRRGKPLMTFGDEFPKDTSVRVEDLNRDGYPDIISAYTPGACGSSYTEDLYLYDPVSHSFQLALSGRSPEYDRAKGEIVFTSCENCACSSYTVETYRLEGKRFVKISEKRENQEEE